MGQIRHFVDIFDHDREFLAGLIDRTIDGKALLRAGKLEPALKGKTLAMYFEKPSLRTRLSFEVGMTQLGGHAIYLTDAEIGLGKREPVKDVARVMSGMCDGIMTRTFSHALVVELATFASVPVINGLSDNSHPCQAMADLVTIKEKLGGLEGLKLVFIGDGNNVARSLAVACGRFEIEFVLAGPAGRQLDDDFVYRLRQSEPGVRFMQTDEPRKAVEGADIVYTDTWISMGQENDRDERIREFQDYQVTTELLKSAKGSAIIMHDLPAYRGYEITDEVIECEQSVVFDQAENRLHFQRALMAVLMGGSQRK